MGNKPKLENHVIKPSVSVFENEVEYRLMPFMTELSLDSKIEELENFMKNNHGFGKSEEDKDKLYDDAKALWRSFTNEFKEVVYTFYLNKKQYQYLMDLLKDKLEYDVNTVFFAIELTKLLGNWTEEGSSKDDNTLKGYLADATETTYIYHLIAKHKIKGISASTYRFSEILLRIGEISKIVSYYDTHAKNLSKEIQDWVSAFDGIVPGEVQPTIAEVV
jgi:hypothetical protein